MNLQERFKKASKDRDNNQVDSAIKQYESIRNNALKAGEKELATDCLHMIGISYTHLENYAQAEKFFQQAESEFKRDGNQLRVGAVLRDRASIAAIQGQLDDSAKLIEQSVAILANAQSLNHLGMSQVKMGMVYWQKGRVAQAEKIIKKGITNLEQSGDDFFTSTGYMNLAEVEKAAGKIDQAKISLEKSLQILNKIAGEDEHLRRRAKIEQLQNQLNS